jgi:hypothetical protein
MSATIRLVKCTGVNAATETDLGATPGIALKSNDTAVNDTTSYPVTIPAVSSGYSYENYLRWRCTAAPDTQCTNFKYWGPAAELKAGADIYVNTAASGAGATPVNTASAVATVRQDPTHYSAATALSIAGTLTGIGQQSAYLVAQLVVDSAVATQGNAVQATHSYSYDEN